MDSKNLALVFTPSLISLASVRDYSLMRSPYNNSGMMAIPRAEESSRSSHSALPLSFQLYSPASFIIVLLCFFIHTVLFIVVLSCHSHASIDQENRTFTQIWFKIIREWMIWLNEVSSKIKLWHIIERSPLATIAKTSSLTLTITWNNY